MSQSQITELRDLGIDQQDTLTRQVSVDFVLRPADRGRDAWLVLAGACLMESLTWGLAFCFGIFQEYYSNLQQFRSQESSIAIVGTVASGMLYLASSLSLALCRQFPLRRRQIMAVGVVILTCAFLGASFATRVWHLILTQGVLFAIGGSLAYYPVFLLIDEWFIQRKGLALGIAWGSTGLSGLIFPYIISGLLSRFGFRTTLRIWAVINLVCMAASMPFLKPRVPPSAVANTRLPRLGFVIKPIFVAFQTGNILQGMGYFMPGIYLPLYARSIGLNNTVAVTSVSLINLGAFLGCITMGLLVDRWTITNVVSMISLISAIAVALFWGFSSSSGMVITFALFYGFFAGSFVVTWAGIVKEVARQEQTAEPHAVFCLLVCGRGLGSLLSGPLSQGLLHVHRFTSNFEYGYGSGFGMLIVFTASTMVAGGLGPLCRRLRII